MRFSIRSRGPRITLAALLLAAPIAADDDEVESFADVVKKGTVDLSLRYRAEAVDDDALEKDAFASTLRTALKLTTARWRGGHLVLEAEDVRVLGDEGGYRNAGAGSLSNGVTERPVVADPEVTEVNQAYLEIEREVLLRLGRQEVNLGDQRFVGSVGWRQNHQSFDALRIDWSGERVGVTYTWLERGHRIFGGSVDLDGHVAFLPFGVGPAGTLTTYAVFLDYEDSPNSSSRTLGLELRGGTHRDERWNLVWEAEWADQQDWADRTDTLDAAYVHGMAGVDIGSFSVHAGIEILQGEPGRGAFSTPLATLHKWNGWADRFLATPPEGLEDLYFSVQGPAGPLRWRVDLHDFAAESSSADYGQEVDLQLVWKLRDGTTLALKGAAYDADEHSTDVTKVMLWAARTF